MEFYIDLIIYIFAILGLILTNITIFESYTMLLDNKKKFYLKNNLKCRYFKKK